MSENDAGFAERKARRQQMAGTWERLSTAGTGSFLPRPGPGDALLGQKVPLRCGKCKARIDHMEARIRGWTLYHGFTGPNARRWSGSWPFGDSLTYQCKCGTVYPVDIGALQAAAPAAWKLDRDLRLGVPRFGLPRRVTRIC